MINGKLFLLSGPGARYVMGRLHSSRPHPRFPGPSYQVFLYPSYRSILWALYKKLFLCSAPLFAKELLLRYLSVHEPLSLKCVKKAYDFLALLRAWYLNLPCICFIQGITLLQDAGTSDDSGRASERLTGSSVAPRDPDSSRDRLSDVSILILHHFCARVPITKSKSCLSA